MACYLHRSSIGESFVLLCRNERAILRISRLQDELDKAHRTSKTAAKAAEEASARVASLERALEECDTASATAAARAAAQVASLERALEEREAASANAAAEASAEIAFLKRSLQLRDAASAQAAAAAAAQAASLQQAAQEREAAFAAAAAQAADQIVALQHTLRDREMTCAAAMGATERIRAAVQLVSPALQRGMEEARPALGCLPCHAAMAPGLLGCQWRQASPPLHVISALAVWHFKAPQAACKLHAASAAPAHSGPLLPCVLIE